MQRLVKQAARFGVTMALAGSTLAAQAELLDNHVLVGPALNLYSYPPPSGYEQAYSVRLGAGSWPYPYVNFYVDMASGKSSYASITAGPSYLSYLQNVNIVQVKAGDEISARTLTDGSLTSFVKVTTPGYFEVNPVTSSTGADPDIYLGFSYGATTGPAYGWAHLRYTQAEGLSLVSSAMTTSDVGIVALTRTTVSPVPELSTASMLGLGLSSIMGIATVRRRQRARKE